MQTYLNDDGDYYQRTGIAVNYGLKATAKNMISDAKYYLGGTFYGNNGYGTADAMYLWERGTSVLNYDNYCFPQYSTIDSNWNTRCTTENYCENNPTDEICNVIRSTSWVGAVALMYPSDHYLVYANGVDAKCYGDPDKCTIGETSSYGTPNLGWIYNSNKLVGQNDINIYWLLSPFTSFSSYGFQTNSIGKLDSFDSLNSNHGVRPVLYLSSNIKIIEGTGESTNPYKLGL